MSVESEIWPAVLEIIGKQVPTEVTYNLWFGDLVLQKLVDDKAYLQTSGMFKKKVLDSRYMDMLKSAFAEVFGFEITPFIISVEDRPFDEQYFELLENEAKELLIEEEARSGRKYVPDYSAPEPAKDPELVEPRSFSGQFVLSKKNLNFPKTYNPKSQKNEDLELINYLEHLGNDEGSLFMTKSVPQYSAGYTFENFVVGDSNRMAFASCYAVAKYPGQHCNPLFIYGPPGLGKTHLLYAIAHKIEEELPSFNIIYCTSEDFTNEMIEAISKKENAEFREKYRSADVLMIDDIQFIGGKDATQLEFFNTFNTLFEANKQIIVASDRPPKDIPVLEKRIRSRFESGAIIDIKSPDPELREAIIRRKAMDLNLSIPTSAIRYITDNVSENVRQIEGIMKHLNIYSVLKNQEVTEELVRSIVGNVITSPVETGPDKIVDAVAKVLSVSREDILGSRHTKDAARARHICAYCLRTFTGMTLQEVGEFLNRHHSTVHDSVKLITKELPGNTSLEEQISLIRKEMGKPASV